MGFHWGHASTISSYSLYFYSTIVLWLSWQEAGCRWWVWSWLWWPRARSRPQWPALPLVSTISSMVIYLIVVERNLATPVRLLILPWLMWLPSLHPLNHDYFLGGVWSFDEATEYIWGHSFLSTCIHFWFKYILTFFSIHILYHWLKGILPYVRYPISSL